MDRTEATGLGVSVFGHLALAAVLVFGLTRALTPRTPSSAIEVSFVDQVAPVSAAPEPTATPPAPSVAPEAGPPEEAAPAPTPRVAPPAPAPEPIPAPPQPRPTPRSAEPAPARERAPPQPARAQPAPARPQAAAPAQPQRQAGAGTGQRTHGSLIGPDLLRGIGSDPSPSRETRPAAQMTGQARASINAAIARALIPCQRQPLPTPDAASIQVVVAVSLERDGSLTSAHVSRVINDNPDLRIYEQRMRDLALNIVQRCTPIRGLPADLYDVPHGWRQFNYTFDPRVVR